MIEVRRQRIFKLLSTVAVTACVFRSMIGHAQDAAGQAVPVEQFLNAFRGKPVGPAAPPPTQITVSQSVQPANYPTTQPPTSTAPHQDTVSGASSCPPGVDRPGCPGTLQQRYPASCPAGTTLGPTGCVATAMPANAHRVSEDGQWQCDDGYLRYGAVCIPIQSSSPH